MKRIIRKQRSALKFLASAKSCRSSELTSSKTLLTSNESDNIFLTLEEDFNNILKTSSDVPTLEIKMQKLWSLISLIRKNEIILRELYDKREAKPVRLKSSETFQNVNNNSKKNDSLNEDIRKISEREEVSCNTSFIMSESEITLNSEALKKEKQNLFKEIINLKELSMKNTEIINELNKKLYDYEEQIKELKNDLELQKSDTIKELKLRQNYENRLKDSQKQIENREKEIETLRFQYNNIKDQLALLERTVNEQKLTNELLTQNNSHLSQKIVKLQSEYNSQSRMFEELTQKYVALSNQTKIYEENAVKMLNDINKNSKLKDIIVKRVQTLENQKNELIAEKDKLISNMNFMEKDVQNWRKKYENDKQNLEDIKREKELLIKHLQQMSVSNDEQRRMLNTEIRMKDQLKTEIICLNKTVSKQNENIYYIEKEKERLKLKNDKLQIEMSEVQEELGRKESIILKLKKQLDNLELNFKQQTGKLKNVTNDKNMYSETLSQTKEEIIELKKKIKNLLEKINEEKENVILKEDELLKEKSILQKLEHEKEKLYSELIRNKEMIRRSDEHTSQLLQAEKQLKDVIKKFELEFEKKEKQVLQILGDRELISTQLLQKNEEIIQLTAKLTLCETEKAKQQCEYKKYLEDNRNLKSEIQHLKTDKARLNKNFSNVSNLRSEIFSLERELNQRKVQCRALEEELQNPLNIHRWRKLKSTDPNAYELIAKIQLLQKRILAKSEVISEKEEQMKELTTLYENLRNSTDNLSKTKITNELYFLRKESNEKSKKIQTLITEMNMYESHAAEYKLELECKNKELKKLKTKYFKQVNITILIIKGIFI